MKVWQVEVILVGGDESLAVEVSVLGRDESVAGGVGSCR